MTKNISLSSIPNPQRDLANHLLQFTGVNVFLTGKAGTGKTTFLHELKRTSPKRMIVVAPTGVAAIQAGGVTIHSFFQLPFGLYLPGYEKVEVSPTTNTSTKQYANKFNREKINIIRSLNLLVIDEISMVRADTLDAINDVLQRYRGKDKPFGGVQLLLIGDLQQLAPIVKDEEWIQMQQYYNSPYFFDSRALQQSHFTPIELKHIYRQSDENFISILNKIRNKQMDAQVQQALKACYHPDFSPKDTEGYITLTTHNNQSKELNEQKLKAIKSSSFSFNATIQGEFPEYSYPTEYKLSLKKGAQVMFVKNDSSVEKRYFNGKIGVITQISKAGIEVQCPNEEDPIEVSPETWKNTKYSINETTKEIVESVEGSFTQYPLKLAWAITIHKSQGLTFEKVIIDAQRAFAHGQVYVALSRCKSLEGLVLKSLIGPDSLKEDIQVDTFSQNIAQIQLKETDVEQYQKDYYVELLQDQFDFSQLLFRFIDLKKFSYDNFFKIYPYLHGDIDKYLSLFRFEIYDIGEKFQKQLSYMVQHAANYEQAPEIKERIQKAAVYFIEKLEVIIAYILSKSKVELDNKASAKQLQQILERFHLAYCEKAHTLPLCLNCFSIPDYLAIKAKALIDDTPLKAKSEPKKTKSKLSKDEKASLKTEKATQTENSSELDIKNPALLEALILWRKALAQEKNLPAYCIVTQKALIGIVNTEPKSDKELLKVNGLGKVKLEKYGSELLDIVDAYRSQESFDNML
ncbi:MAG: AAA family ATPase [Bacteroidales bacterium]